MNCKIIGYEFKTLEVTLASGESFYAERGSVVYTDEALQRDVEFNNDGGSGLGSILGGVVKSALSGESIEVDENHIVALHGFSSSQIQAGWSVGNVLRGEGLSLMKITGPGKLYLSPLPIIINRN